MAKTFLKLNKRSPLKDGSYTVQIAVGYGRDIYLSTGVSVLIDNWDAKLQLCTGPDAKSKNDSIAVLYTKAVTRIMELRLDGRFNELSNSQIRYYIENGKIPEPEKPKKPTLGMLYRQVMAVKSKRNAELFNDTLKKLTAYTDIDKVQFEDINKFWLDSFCASLGDLAPNTKSIHLRNLRTVINYAIDCEVTTNYPFLRYKIPHAKTRKRSLQVDVLRKIATAELDEWMGIYRDLFMLSFYLIGINVIDLCNLTEIKDGRIEYTRAKTHKPYSVKVEPEALEIIQRLKGEKYLLYILEKHSTYRTFYMQWCRALNRIKETLGIAELTTYWARHSWATIASSLDIPKDTISHGLGHGGNTVTDIYIDFDISKVDNANRQVIDYVLYGKEKC